MRPEEIEERLRGAMRAAGVTVEGARVAARVGEPAHVIVDEVLATGVVTRNSISAVLCPVDFPPAALHALEFAMDLAHRGNASVTFLHGVEWLADEDRPPTPHFAVPEFRRCLMQAAREQLAAVIARQPHLEKGVTTEVTAARAHRQSRVSPLT